jgi:hypothetical protein
VPRDEEIAPLGRVGSPTRVAFAYAVEAHPTGNADASVRATDTAGRVSLRSEQLEFAL